MDGRTWWKAARARRHCKEMGEQKQAWTPLQCSRIGRRGVGVETEAESEYQYAGKLGSLGIG